MVVHLSGRNMICMGYRFICMAGQAFGEVGGLAVKAANRCFLPYLVCPRILLEDMRFQGW